MVARYRTGGCGRYLLATGGGMDLVGQIRKELPECPIPLKEHDGKVNCTAQMLRRCESFEFGALWNAYNFYAPVPANHIGVTRSKLGEDHASRH